ncbi:MAG: hypothetical protein J6C79_04575 [Clostridia bacterium]|nr:hypothetical protein [Clostridia bacterium]
MATKKQATATANKTEEKQPAIVEETKTKTAQESAPLVKSEVKSETVAASKTAKKATAKKPTESAAEKSAATPAEHTAEETEKTEHKEETPVAKAEEKPVEKPCDAPAEKSEEKTQEKAEVKATEQVEEKAEEKKDVFVPDPKDRRPRGYVARLQVSARYTDEQAQNMLRKKIYQYKEVHLRFLRKVEEPTAFSIEKLFVPVYCGQTDVRYSWKTKKNKAEVLHEEICTKERRFSGANKDLDAANFLLENAPEVMEKKRSELLSSDEYNFKKTVQEFNDCIRSTAPVKGAKVEKRGEAYTLVYVPVMKATCTLDGEKYVGYVNLYNGACYSSYKVTDMVERAAEKAVISAKLAKRTLWGTFLFTMTFCLLTVLAALKLTGWDFGALTTETIWVSCVLAALALPSLALAIGVTTVKKEALIDKAIRTSRLPGVAWSRFVSVVGVLCTLGAVALFFFQVMI